MKYLALVTMLIMAWAIQSYAVAPKGIFPYPYQVHMLDNGLKVVLIPMDNPGLVAYYTVVRTGSRDEYEPGHSGFAHFFEHMMFRGTKNYPGDVYDRLITEMGASANAYTSFDQTVFHLNITTDDLEEVMKLESDRFQNLDYSEQGFKTEAGAVHGEYLKGLTSPFFAIYEKLMNTAFDQHTYRHTVIGFKEDIEAMPTMYEYSKSFYHRYYRPDNVVLLITGDFDPTSAMELVKQYYGAWEKGYVPPKITPEPEQNRERGATVNFSGQTLPILCVAYKGLAFDPSSKDMAACDLLAELAFGETSDLYKKLVINEQRVQFIEADFSANRDPGLMSIYTMIKDENDITNIQDEIYSTIEQFQDQEVDAAKLDALKSHLKYKFLMDMDTAENTASELAGYIALSGGIDAVDVLYRTYDAVTPTDVIEAANRYFTKQKRTVVVLKGGKSS
ncbi:insulinase family protein [candidate division KSB1 bacterium]|nr:insulinase family protein [candidate division KSB1 bacterium]